MSFVSLTLLELLLAALLLQTSQSQCGATALLLHLAFRGPHPFALSLLLFG